MKICAVLSVLSVPALGAVLTHVAREQACEVKITPNVSTYAPVQVPCPVQERWLRPAEGVSNDEAMWVQGRKAKVLQGLGSYLGRLDLDDFDLHEYLTRISCNADNVPTIGMAISGGAWSSALTGTGALRAFDAGFGPSAAQKTGGILQSLSYLSGLSGGSWPVISLATYNFPAIDIDGIVAQWDVDVSPLNAPADTTHRATFATLFKQLYTKFEAGYNVSFGDLLGRASAYEFVAGPEGGLATTVSGIAELSNFQAYEMPFPIWQAVQAVSTDPEQLGIKVPTSDAVIYEWSPFEFGSWEGPSAFFPTKYLGSKIINGAPAGTNDCVVGFDSASFMLGLATDAWNFWFLGALSNGTLGAFTKREESVDKPSLRRRAKGLVFPIATLESLTAEFKKLFNYTRDEALYSTLPNPFATNISVNNNVNPPENLTLIDGSESGQSLPLWPLIQPARHTDFLIAWDSDEEAAPYSWTNGASLHATYKYATDRSIPFPVVPPSATFVNLNYTWKPVFFGCEANLTNTNSFEAPIVLYLANSPYSSYTNYSGFQANFTNEEVAVILTNGFNIVTQGNSTLDADWPECIGCAAIDRSLARIGMPRTEQCQQCMLKHCWDGVEDNSDPDTVVDLSLVLDPSLTFAEWNKSFPQNGLFWEEVSK